MRSVLSFGGVLLVALALLRLAAGSLGGPATAGSDRALSVLAGSCGYMLPSAPMEGGSERFDDAISVGDLVLTERGAGPGLRVAAFRPGLDFQFFTNFDTASDPRAAVKLMERFRGMAIGAVVVIEAQGKLVGEAASVEELDEIPLLLGAEMTPFRAPAASWAMVACRTSRGWRTLSESYSEERAVHLAMSVSPDVARYVNHRNEVFIGTAVGRQTLELSETLAWAEPALEGERAPIKVRWAPDGNPARSGILLRASGGKPAVVRWSDVPLGPDAMLTAALGVQRYTGELRSPARISVLVDGEELGQLEGEFRPGAGWLSWGANLIPYSGQVVDIELRVEPLDNELGVPIVLGDVSLVWGIES